MRSILAASFVIVLLAASLSLAIDDGPKLADGVVSLAKGAVEFDAPSGWEAVKVTNLETTRGYRKAGSYVSVKALAAGQKITAESGPPMVKAIGAELKKQEAKVLLEPAVVEDGRFDLKITEKHEAKGQAFEAVYLHKVVGNRTVVVTVLTSQAGEAGRKAIGVGEKLLLEARVGGPDLRLTPSTQPSARPVGQAKRVALGRAGVNYSVSNVWDEKLTDKTEGMLAEYRMDGGRVMLVSGRRLPPEAKDPAVRDLIVQEMVKSEGQQLKLNDASARGEKETISDARFLRKTRTTYELHGQKVVTDSRQVLVGELIVSVSTMCRGEDSAYVEEAADGIAASAKKN